jgi:hypothetical protein
MTPFLIPRRHTLKDRLLELWIMINFRLRGGGGTSHLFILVCESNLPIVLANASQADRRSYSLVLRCNELSVTVCVYDISVEHQELTGVNSFSHPSSLVMNPTVLGT